MSTTERMTRPKLERTQAIRNWSTVLGQSNPSAPRADASRLEDVVSRSVDLGYRVVDEYIRQAQGVAGRLRGATSAPESLALDAQHAATRMARYASDFLAAWLGLLEVGANGQSAANDAVARHAPEPDPTKTDRTERGATAVVDSRAKLEIESTRPTTVSLELRIAEVRGPLTVHALRSTDPEKPRMSDVGVRSAASDESPVFWVRVREDHPEGVYEGLILDETTNRPVGALRVTLSPPAQAGAVSKRPASRRSGRSNPSAKRR